VNWDLPTPHLLQLQVENSDIDALGHVNNATYVSWLEQCAWQHSAALGLSLAAYRRLDRAMVVHRHEIDYLQPAFVGDILLVGTWIVASDQRLRLSRQFQIQRQQDAATVLRARSDFVCIELSSGRARRMPTEFIAGYGRAMVQEAIAQSKSP